MPPSLDSPDKEIFSQTVLVELRVIKDAVVKLENGLEKWQSFCREDMGSLYGTVNQLVAWKERHNGAEDVKKEIREEAPQWQQSKGIIISAVFAGIAGLSAFAMLVITYTKG